MISRAITEEVPTGAPGAIPKGVPEAAQKTASETVSSSPPAISTREVQQPLPQWPTSEFQRNLGWNKSKRVLQSDQPFHNK
jgi:hypothetical protein